MVIVFPAIWWRWSPPLVLVSFAEDPLRSLAGFAVPSLILGTYLSAATMRMTRTMMLEVLRQDYIRTAWSKGLLERAVILRHAVKNALIPVVSLVALQVPILVGGSVIMENIFNLPGLGRLLVDALTIRDYPIVSGVNLVFATVVVAVNLVTDLSYALIDPRVRYRGAVIAAKEHVYFEAARAVGSSRWRTLLHHLLPNIAPVLIVIYSINIGARLTAVAGSAMVTVLGSRRMRGRASRQWHPGASRAPYRDRVQ